MDKNTILILVSVLSAPFLGQLIVKMFDRKKSGAETHNINITGEISISEQWQKYALQQQKDKEELRTEFADKLKRLESLIEEKEMQHASVIAIKDRQILSLQERVGVLEKELSEYRNK